MERTPLQAAGTELVTAAGWTEGRTERRLHGEVIELAKLGVGDEPTPEALDGHVAALRELATEAGPGAEHVERALAHVREYRETVE
ncbi:DUF7553 family protein [Halomarina litorea]|uniref:DUF7553 family protein n=1 Tax=Halomarina litorea TaxID=2961595 RepID=UPI0020C3941C|nr:hypothetical protein [Halomarina sp. BCD28]